MLLKAICPKLLVWSSLFYWMMNLCPAQPFQVAVGMQGLDMGQVLKALPDGGFIIAGNTDSYASEDRNMLLVRTDGAGNVLWTSTFGGPERETVNDIIQTGDGGFLLASEKYRLNSTEGEFLINIKTDSLGQLMWKRLYDEGGNETEGYSVQPTNDGGYVIVGIYNKLQVVNEAFFTVKNEAQSIYLIKVNASGNKVWSKVFNPANAKYKSASAISMCTTHDGNFLITGNLALKVSVDSLNEGRMANKISESEVRNLVLLKVDQNGNLLWAKEFDGNQIDMGYAVKPKKSGAGYFVGGVTNLNTSSNIDIFLMSINENGDVEWANTYGGSDYEAISDLQEAGDGSVIISGLTRSSGNGSNDALLLKTDPSGNLLWAKAYGSTGGETATSVAVTADGYVFTGDVLGKGSEETDMYLVRTDINGNSGCHEVPVSFNQHNYSVNNMEIKGSLMRSLTEEDISPNIKTVDINNIKATQHQNQVKNLCNY